MKTFNEAEGFRVEQSDDNPNKIRVVVDGQKESMLLAYMQCQDLLDTLHWYTPDKALVVTKTTRDTMRVAIEMYQSILVGRLTRLAKGEELSDTEIVTLVQPRE